MINSNSFKIPKEVELFGEGENYFAYRYFGAHKMTFNGIDGVVFRVYAPNAKEVFVTGDFNNWELFSHPSNYLYDGIWELFIPDIEEYTAYKYAITPEYGETFLKADPYAFHSETDGKTASKVYFLDGCFEWDDDEWLMQSKEGNFYSKPMNIYEVHIGSWRRYEDGNCFDYRKIADELIPYVKDMGYTHIELMPITEYPFPASWGYQVTGYFSVTSRYGTPADFMYFVNKAHKLGIGIILDWVPAHFPKDAFALSRFDGTCLYEDPNPMRGEHKSWGTLIFDFGKAQVQSFLVSSAMMFVKEYHIDGIRVDAVAAMLYLDYDRPDGEWCQNELGGKENLQAIAFLQKLNHAISTHSNSVMIAEESTAWPLVTKPPTDGGLGFHFKWNMGWMNDSLSYIKTDPLFRKYEHSKLTFPLVYAFSENYILPISHDEVVYGKKSLLDKMPGDYQNKFDGMRSFLLFMLSQPGKKLLFMGSELGQFAEWQFDKELDWNLLSFEAHKKLHHFVKKVNHFYLDNKCLWEIDDSWDGFKWINPDDADHNIISYKRIDKDGKELLFIVNFAPVLREEYTLVLDKKKTYKEIFNTDNKEFGGSGLSNKGKLVPVASSTGEYHLSVTLPPLAAIVLM